MSTNENQERINATKPIQQRAVDAIGEQAVEAYRQGVKKLTNDDVLALAMLEPDVRWKTVAERAKTLSREELEAAVTALTISNAMQFVEQGSVAMLLRMLGKP